MTDLLINILGMVVRSTVETIYQLTGDKPSEEEIKEALSRISLDPPKKADLPEEFGD